MDALGQSLPDPELANLQRRIRRNLEPIHASLKHGMFDGLIESTNAKIGS